MWRRRAPASVRRLLAAYYTNARRAFSPTSVARPRGRPGAPGRTERVHRNHAVRLHEIRGRQGIGVPARRPAAAIVRAAADLVWIRAADVLRRARAQAGARCQAR